MAQNIFMVQRNFLIPLRRLDDKYRKQFERGDTKSVKSYFCVKENNIECRYISLEKHDFYFESFPNNSRSSVFHKVNLESYVISYSLSPKYKRQYFLVVTAKTDKCFGETYILNGNRLVLMPPYQICTDRDLIYLQKAFYEKPKDKTSKEGLFYPLNDPMENHIMWVRELCSRLEGKKERDISFEYSTISVISSDINFANLIVTKKVLDRRMADNYYAPGYQDFDNSWNGDDARFAMCLISGNDNINNVSASVVGAFSKYTFSTNKYERTYANKNGIIFLHTHHPFELSAEDLQKYNNGNLPIDMPEDLGDAHNISELCTALFFKQKLGCISKRLGEKHVTSVKDALARLANYLHTEYTHIADIDKKFIFVCRQMGFADDFDNLSGEAELQLNSYSLRLSTRFNKLMVLLAAVALVPTVFQIIQTFIYNQKSFVMKHPCCGPTMEADAPLSACGTYCFHDPIIFALILLAVFLVLLGLYNYVLIPYVKKKHKQFHEEMEDEI